MTDGAAYKGFEDRKAFDKKMNKILKIISYVFLGAVILVVLLLVFSILPITGNYKILTVLSGSMEPSIKTGSVVIVKPVSVANYKIGDIITFGPMTKTKPPTTHRIVEMKVAQGNVIYLTKGDANNAPDARELLQKDVIGKVLLDMPYIGYAVAGAQKPWGFAALIILPALIIVGDQVKKIWLEAAKIRKNKRESLADKL